MNAAAEHDEARGSGSAWDARAWGMIVGVALLLVPMLVRLQTPLDLLPYWDGDPFTQEASIIGLTPALSLYGDVVSLIGAAVLLAFAPRRGRFATLAGVVLVAAGAAACVWHLTEHAFNAKEAVSGGAWISGVAGAFALWRVAGDRRVRLLVFALIIGAVGLLATKGAYQVAVEHPATVDAFMRDRESILAQNGWSPDSSMAKAYERRLKQAEATGWFGFANVYASFAAAGVAVFSVLAARAWLTWRSAREEEEGEPGRWPLILSGAGFAVSAAALAMAGAKGGFAAALVGLAVAFTLEWARRREAGRAVWLRLIGPAVIAAPLLAVVARGVVGERIGELSLLFRWFYMQGAARIFGANWLHGVGPDGFQAAYSLAKNPLSPEDVTSPHSLLWDWAACLGIGGLAWGALLLWMSTRLGSGALAEEPASEAGDDHADWTRKLMRAICLIAALSAVLSIPTQYAAMLPEEALGVRIGGLVVWCVLSCAVLAVAQRCIGWRIALAAGACVLLTHTQIEITGVWPQSCGLLLALIAVAAGPIGGRVDADQGEQTTHAAGRWPQYVCAAVVLWIGLVALRTAGVARQWENSLADAYTLATPVRELRRQIAGAASDPSEQAKLARRLMVEEPRAAERIIDRLPRSWPLVRNASQIALEESRGYASRGDASGRVASKAWAVQALSIALGRSFDSMLVHDIEGAFPASVAAESVFQKLSIEPVDNLDSQRAGWAATVCLAAADLQPEPDRALWRNMAARLLRQAHARDPYNPLHLTRLMDVLETLGDAPAAAEAARTLLGVDALQRLDRSVRGLSDRDRARAERIASSR